MADDSSRTKMLKDAPTDEDMGPVKRMLKQGMVKGSELMDRMGLTQEKQYEGKTKEEMAVKKAKGGMIKSSASKRADGCAVKGKTRGKMV